jgi:hypothetical protein
MSLVFDPIARLDHDVGKLHWVMMLENSTGCFAKVITIIHIQKILSHKIKDGPLGRL